MNDALRLNPSFVLTDPSGRYWLELPMGSRAWHLPGPKVGRDFMLLGDLNQQMQTWAEGLGLHADRLQSLPVVYSYSDFNRMATVHILLFADGVELHADTHLRGFLPDEIRSQAKPLLSAHKSILEWFMGWDWQSWAPVSFEQLT